MTNPPPKEVVTVRLPPELHARLKEAAHDVRVSMNEFAVTALHYAVEKHEQERKESHERTTIGS